MAKINVTVFMCLAVGIFIEPALAQPPRVNGCTSGDLNTAGGTYCSKKAEANILNDGPRVVAQCSGGKIYCCVGGRCVDVTDFRRAPKDGSKSQSSIGSNDGGGSAAGGGNVGSAAPSGPTKGSGNGCSGGVC
jgi:hypothetical protein